MNILSFKISSSSAQSILECFAHEENGFSIAELIAKTGLSKTAVVSAIKILVSSGYIYPSPVGNSPTYFFLSSRGQYAMGNSKKDMPTASPDITLQEFEKNIFPIAYQRVINTHPSIGNFFETFRRDKSNDWFVEIFPKAVYRLWQKEWLFSQTVEKWNSIDRQQNIGNQYAQIAPKTITSVEQAILEQANIMLTYVKELKGKALDVSTEIGMQQQIQAFLKRYPYPLIEKLLVTYPAGTMISDDVPFIDKLMRGLKVTRITKTTEEFNHQLYYAVSNQHHGNNLTVFFSNTPKEEVIASMRRMLATKDVAGTVFKNFRTSSERACKNSLDICGKIFAGLDCQGANYQNADFDSITFNRTNFRGATNLIDTSWKNAVIENCNFDGADMSRATLHAQEFSGNSIDGTNFQDIDLPKGFKFDQTIGSPINFVYVDVSRAGGEDNKNTAEMSQIVRLPPVSTHAIGIGEGDVPDARTIYEALDGILKIKALSALRLDKFSSMAPDEITSLREWLSNQALELPNIAGVSDANSLLAWLQEQNKSGALKEAGLGKEMGPMFARVKNLMSGGAVQKPKGQVVQDRIREQAEQARKAHEQKIQAFVAEYADKESVPKSALLGLLVAKDGVSKSADSPLVTWLDGCSDPISKRQLSVLKHLLWNSLNSFHANPYVQPKKRFRTFPHTAFALKLDENAGGNFQKNFFDISNNSNTQFKVILQPTWSDIPPAYATAFKYMIYTNPKSHIIEGLAHAKVNALNYTSITPGKSHNTTTKKIWYISEQQCDTYQESEHTRKKNKETGEDEDVRQETGEDEDVRQEFIDVRQEFIKDINKRLSPHTDKFRSFFRDWPEVLLNAVITLAGNHGVDEVWVGHGDDALANRNKDNVNWKPYYDEPALVFGGQDKNIGTEMPFDPGYKEYHDDDDQGVDVKNVFVIPIPKKVLASLQLGGLHKQSDYDWNTISEQIEHHIHFCIAHNRETFLDVQEFVTDEQIAQFGFDSFFREYNIPLYFGNDVDSVDKLKGIILQHLGFHIWDPPYLDWLGWVDRAFKDCTHSVKEQKEISPDMNASDQELARDWWKNWLQDHVKPDIKRASWYESQFVATIKKMLEAKGFGDITGTDYIPPSGTNVQEMLNPTNRQPGELAPIGEGERDPFLPGNGPEAEKPKDTNLHFEAPSKHELINHLLDEYHKEQEKPAPDQAKLERLKKEFQQITAEAALRALQLA